MTLPEWPPLLGQRVEIISATDCPHHPRIKPPPAPGDHRMFGRVRSINTRRTYLPDHPYWVEADSGSEGYVSLDELEPVESHHAD